MCRVCLMAWTGFARVVTGGETIAEPDITAMRHLDHVQPILECAWCRAGLGIPGVATRLDGSTRTT